MFLKIDQKYGWGRKKQTIFELRKKGGLSLKLNTSFDRGRKIFFFLRRMWEKPLAIDN